MPRSKNTPRETAVKSLHLVINFGDDATQWFQNLSAAVSQCPLEIEIQFIGGCVAPPDEIIALRNALLRVPRATRLVTTALVSLPPLTCAAWLVGDERRIARDAVVWVPELPEDILRNGLRLAHQTSIKAEEVDDGGETEEGNGKNVVSGQHKISLGRQRCERDLRALADALNEWFPSWEFNGSCLTFEELVAWGVVTPEWGFGGRGVRHRPVETLTKEPVNARGKAENEASLNVGKFELDKAKLHMGDAGEHAISKNASNGSDTTTEPKIAAEPSDL